MDGDGQGATGASAEAGAGAGARAGGAAGAGAGAGASAGLVAGAGAGAGGAAGAGAGAGASAEPVAGAGAGAGGGADASADAGAAAAALRVALDGIVQSLVESGARTEALGAFEQRRSILGIRRGPALVPKARVWRLGVLLLDAQGGLHEVGAVTRAVDPGRVTNQSPRAEERRDYRRAAYQGTFERGDTVNYDTTPVALDAAGLRAGSGPLALVGGTVMVRWNKQPGAAGLTPLTPYLIERAALLTAPLP
ncbi:hypothetical protein ACEXOS_005925 [Herbiconiux sp. P16]|uniref:hypothetical protein n=1 Tax=Herbiconiux wuyangfengii TaxID=3342794 RepID=UPI0035B9DCA0